MPDYTKLLNAAREVFGRYQLKGRNAAVLPSVTELPDDWNRTVAKYLRDAAPGQHERTADPLWLHAKRIQRPEDVPTEMYDVDMQKGPLYFTNEPMIALNAEYAVAHPWDTASRFIWPYILADDAVPTVKRVKGQWRSEASGLDEDLQMLKAQPAYDDMISTLRQASNAPPNLLWRGVRDVHGDDYGMRKQDQLMLRTPLQLLREGKLIPVFDEAQPFNRGGLVALKH